MNKATKKKVGDVEKIRAWGRGLCNGQKGSGL